MEIPKSIVITGVSTGIGYAAVDAFIKRGCRVFGSVRKQADAERLKADFGDAFTPLIFDVTDTDSVILARKIVEQELKGSGLGCLINNAGIAVGGPIQHLPIEELRKQFEVNVISLIEITQQFLPLLGAREDHPVAPGKIINISSAAGKLSAPFLGAYSGSKHALEGLSGSMRKELQVHGIDVIVVGPGAIKTPIWDKANELPAYEGTVYAEAISKFRPFVVKQGKNGWPPERIGEKLADIFFMKKPKARYALVQSKFQRWTLPRWLPTRMVDRIVGKNLGFIK